MKEGGNRRLEKYISVKGYGGGWGGERTTERLREAGKVK